MRRTRKNSRIEIWHGDYVNHPEVREAKDRKAVIVQIEPVNGKENAYFVEVIG